MKGIALLTTMVGGGYYLSMDTKQNEAIEQLIKKIEGGELTEAEELQVLKEINFSYDVLNKFLEEIKMEQLKANIK